MPIMILLGITIIFQRGAYSSAHDSFQSRIRMTRRVHKFDFLVPSHRLPDPLNPPIHFFQPDFALVKLCPIYLGTSKLRPIPRLISIIPPQFVPYQAVQAVQTISISHHRLSSLAPHLCIHRHDISRYLLPPLKKKTYLIFNPPQPSEEYLLNPQPKYYP